MAFEAARSRNPAQRGGRDPAGANNVPEGCQHTLTQPIEETTMLQGVGFAADATGYGRERIFWRMVELE